MKTTTITTTTTTTTPEALPVGDLAVHAIVTIRKEPAVSEAEAEAARLRAIEVARLKVLDVLHGIGGRCKKRHEIVAWAEAVVAADQAWKAVDAKPETRNAKPETV